MTDRFRTAINIEEPPFKISYQSKCFLTGSCFTEAIGERMIRYKLPAMFNPLGVLYNPASISKIIRMMMHGRLLKEDDLHFHNGLWLSMDYHTLFSHPCKEACLSGINASLMTARMFLKQCKYLFITFGTAWIYIFKETGEIVANCHKIPATAFERKLLEPEDIVMDYQTLTEELHHYNPGVQIIFTVSPIRHMKDGAFQNQVSKSILLYAIYKLQKMSVKIHYFPAYEIFMDELRDYRFYAGDMLHPSEQGMAYIWDRFCDTYFDNQTKEIMAGVEKIHKAVAHRPFQAGSPVYLTFIDQTRQQIGHLQKLWPFLDFSAEIKKLNDILKDNRDS